MVTVSSVETLDPFLDSFTSGCPKTGMHNPYKNVNLYLELANVCRSAGHVMSEPEGFSYFSTLIQRTTGKELVEAAAEVRVTANFLKNWSGDQVRLTRGFSVPGDHDGQMSHGMRWLFGSVAFMAPFNFPLEIIVLQLVGALLMGNRPIIKGDSKVSVVFRASASSTSRVRLGKEGRRLH